jgi:hypothetical protein
MAVMTHGKVKMWIVLLVAMALCSLGCSSIAPREPPTEMQKAGPPYVDENGRIHGGVI